jgi:hypothetical protein
MRRVILIPLMTLLLCLFAGVAMAEVINCSAGVTCNGTSGDDEINGTSGEDYIIANQGGADKIFAGKGIDKINTVDEKADDTIDCGGGSDQSSFDTGDAVNSSCEGSGQLSWPIPNSNCNTPLQTRINNAVAGSTLDLTGCTYREAVTVPKALTLDWNGSGGIKGSDVWTGQFTTIPNSGGQQISNNAVPTLSTEPHDNCINDDDRCDRPEQVFVNGTELTQVATSATPGASQFKIDANRKIILGAAPAGGAVVEVTTRTSLVDAGADDVHLLEGTFEHSGNRSQDGMIDNDDYDGFLVQDSHILHSNATGVSVTDDGATQSTPTGQLIGNEIAYNGQLGIHNSKGQIEVSGDGCDIHHNGLGGFDPTWEAGGAKFAGVKNGGTYHEVLVDGCDNHDNIKGFWSDTTALDVTVSNNRIWNNQRFGVQIETTDGADVFGNVLYDNGYSETRLSVWGSQILVSSSINTDVHDNIVAWGPDGIGVISADRDGTMFDAITGVTIHGNTILRNDRPNQAWALAWKMGASETADATNFGENNSYWYNNGASSEGSQDRFAWGATNYKNLTAFNATPGEENGVYLNNTQKNAVVSTYSLPSSPAQ